MTKRTKIFIVLIAMSVIAIFVLAITSRPPSVVENKTDPNKKKIDLAKLEENYKQNVKKIIGEYEISGTAASGASTIEKVAACKKRLMDLKVPSAYKDLHLDLVFALDKMSDYISNDDQKKLEESQNLINLAKNNYPWLAN